MHVVRFDGALNPSPFLHVVVVHFPLRQTPLDTAAMTLSLAERRELGSAENRSKSIKTLMTKYKCSAETVKRWRARGQERKPDFSDKPRVGRPHA